MQQEPTQSKQKRKKTKQPNKSVQWSEDTIDNENAGKLKFNVCRAQFTHKLDEDEKSDTCTSDDESNAIERDKKSKQRHKLKCSKLKLKDNS
ncbi:unnamed protein product (macronuclear) [Paramecium tetraurelia]|uniref:Uncharacterized protein n=1 Tax=Paramecium tetraurelia TaxID=5888 RepID=A0E7A8_PARTE|nr:uncharacterized protein GSPATT00023903001 [Paramecium tetraurelia]CAK91175.1 unnamed protein product [Paramecium tetraurelia]|eukprot:XP_001458572.1 hypothetical protein (macronuclear) [Paramecium tetraurelia strain d4-2]